MPSSEMVEKARALAWKLSAIFSYPDVAPEDTVDEVAGKIREFAESAVREAVSECAEIAEEIGCGDFEHNCAYRVAAALRKKYGVADGGKS